MPESNKSIDLFYKNLVENLVQRQSKDGLWPYQKGNDGSPEPACWAALATRTNKKALDAFVKQILLLQNSDGGWSSDSERMGSDWTTAVVLMTLRILLLCSASDLGNSELPIGQIEKATKKAVDWLIQNRTEKYVTPGARFALLLWKGPEYDYERGWPWTPATFDWVEPTAYALLALRQQIPDEDRAKKMIGFAESYLLNSACPQGGWNCGDRTPIGPVLAADVQFSTLALFALKSKRNKEAIIEKSIAFIKNREMESLSECAWGALALKAFKEDHSRLIGQIMEKQPNAELLSNNILTSALTCLAIEDSHLTDYI
ncbi:MAG: terpene cyclase/mutase family protein [Candidatus Obscuribacterales bacterium]|jgi:hypothetical protein|nr:terpene cyclase/mutase family protein [Candidatus Obscuribacterales bacterium]